MTDSGKDVLVRATREATAHKMRGSFDDPAEYECYWSVSGTPRQTSPGATIWFAVDGEIYARGTIRRVEDGRFVFSPLESVSVVPPCDPPTRGYTYIHTVWSPDVTDTESSRVR